MQKRSSVYFYDEFDVTDIVCKGKNLIAMKIHSRDTKSAGMLFELELYRPYGIELLLQKVGDWKCKLSEAYSRNTPLNIGRIGYSEYYSMTAGEFTSREKVIH